MEEQSSKFGFVGIAIGSIALLLALLHFWAGPFSPQPTLEQTVAKKATAIKQATIAALKGQEAEVESKGQPLRTDSLIDIATALLGGIAIIMGVMGYAKKEPLRVASGAAVLGSSAIAFQFAALALGVIVVTILVAVVLSQIGIS